MAEGDLQVVLGAGGGTGSSVVEVLLAGGARVRSVRHRPADGDARAETVVADLSTADGARRAVDGAAVVYHCAQPDYTRWGQEFPELNRTIARATAEAGAKLVFADNLYMYDPSRGPISEATPQAPPTQRGRLRAEMADELLAMHADGTLRVAIGRASDYYGPNGIGTTLGDRLFDAILAGKKAQWMGALDRPHTCSYLPDVARALVTLGTHDGANGQPWVLPAAEPITGRDFIALAATAAGTSPKAATISPAMMRVAGVFVPFLRAYTEMLGQWTAPFTTDDGAFQERFGPFAVMPHREAIAATVDWFRGWGTGVRAA